MKSPVSAPVNVLARQKGADHPCRITTGTLDITITLCPVGGMRGHVVGDLRRGRHHTLSQYPSRSQPCQPQLS